MANICDRIFLEKIKNLALTQKIQKLPSQIVLEVKDKKQNLKPEITTTNLSAKEIN